MKRIALTILAVCIFVQLRAQSIETAVEAVNNMGVGWNLGNTLDANGQTVTTDVNNVNYWGQQGLESEEYWGQKTTTPELFVMLKNAGFGAVRVPVTWYNHMDKDGKVNAEWMARVHEVVDYVVSNGLYCIVNVHHDTGADGANFVSWLKADAGNYSKNKSRYEYLWKQIAEEFKDYDGRLLFEAYNEMLDAKSSWCFASFATSNHYDAAIADAAYKAINNYAQSFIDAVRATGGNNVQRNLIVNTYAAANGSGTWNQHLKEPLTRMLLPQDPAEGHIIFEVHAYPAIATKNNAGQVVDRTLSEIHGEIDAMIGDLNSCLVTKGAPIIIGEWGTSSATTDDGQNDYDVRRELMFQFVDYFVKQTKANGMATFYWMGLSDGFLRAVPAFSQADLAERIVKAYHGDDFQGEYPELGQIAEFVCFEGEKELKWGDGININAEIISSFGNDVQLELTYSQTLSTGDDIQFFLGNWSAKTNVVVDGRTYEADFGPSWAYNTAAGSNHVTTFSFPKADYDKIAKLGLIIHGNGVLLTRAVLRDPNASGISQQPLAEPEKASALYNLLGQRVHKEQKGVLIKGGKKYCVK